AVAGSCRAGADHRLPVIGAELPRILADVLGGGTEHGALDRDAAVDAVVVPRRKKTLDWDAEQYDSAFGLVDMPAGDAVGIRIRRQRADLEPHLLQLRPGAAQELDRRTDGQ